MSEHIWEEIESVAATLERLQREVARCTGPTPYKAELEAQIAEVSKRREELLEELRKAASG